MERILVVRGGAIGDFVLTLPALELLREAFRRSRIEILGYKHIVALAEHRYYADAVRSIEYGPLASFFARGTELPSELADYFHSFDLVISYLFDPDRIFETNVKRCGVDNFIACDPKIAGGEHASIQLARPLATGLGVKISSPCARLFPTTTDRQCAAAFLDSPGTPVVAFHPGSGSATKNWPIEHWRELAERMLAGNGGAGSLLIVGGEADGAALGTLRSDLRGDAVRFGQNLPLPQLAAVLERCALFIGHDSGISHIAAAVGTDSLLLFGPTDPAVWAPAGRNVHVLRAPTRQLSDISVDLVYEAARMRLNAAPEVSS